MAEQIPYGVAGSVMNRLASSAFLEIGLIYGVKGELRKLQDTIASIKAVLLDAEEKQEQDHAVKNWINRFKEVLFDADDLLDDFLIEDLRHKADGRGKVVGAVGEFFSSSNPIAFRLKMAHKLEAIRKQFNNVAEDLSKLNLNQRVIVIKQDEKDTRETSSFVIESDIIGRDESKKEIIDLLLQTQSNQSLSSIAIVGFGGLGKTALAQLVYNDAEVMNFFQKRAWVSVSQEFEVKPLLKKFLESLTMNRVDDQQLELLQYKVRESLKDQRYLLVLDDVWNESYEKWSHLRNYLMCGAQGSKILVTTRNKMVAETMGVNLSYDLEGLTEEQSWSLFEKLAFRESTMKRDPNLVSVGQKIAEKCKGVPLAIRTIGSLLQSKTNESEWVTILHGDFWMMYQNYYRIMPVLKLSYDNLPIELKQCFSYCSLYPKGWKIEKEQLIQLWMAQGYLQCATEQQRLEDLGNQYVTILLKRSFFHDVETNDFGGVEYFKMHDLMHDLALSVSGTDCWLDSEGEKIVERSFHLSFSNEIACSLDSINKNRLRTFFRPGGMTSFPSIHVLSGILNLRCLRALDLSYVTMAKLPSSICELKHLRYLDLSYCYSLTSMPNSISNLVNLQTLKLYHCHNLEILPKGMLKLVNLRHLKVDFCKAFKYKMPSGLGKWTSLQYLSKFIVGDSSKRKSAKLNELKDLNDLRGELYIINLHLVKNVMLESKEVNLKGKKYLQSLCLEWDNLTEVRMQQSVNKNSDSLQLLDNLHPHENLNKLIVSRYPGVKFSCWLSSLTNIVEISLQMFENCLYLPAMEQLPFLKCLKVRDMYAMEYICFECCEETSVTNSSSLTSQTISFFPSLKKLELVNCPNLRGWKRMSRVREDAAEKHLSLPPFPHLSSLSIKDCLNLTCLPTFPDLAEEMILNSCSMKPVMDTLQVNIVSTTEEDPKLSSLHQSSSSSPLSTVKFLEIGNIGIEVLPEEWMQNLASLEHLRVNGFPSIAPVFLHMQHLRATIQRLEISNVDNLDHWDNYDIASIQCKSLIGLHSVQTIFIHYCNKLKDFPKWICCLPSLKHIKIWNCYYLESLPEEMRCLTNLQSLRILMCPLLSERCKRETGADWHKIAHIPKIYDDFHNI